MSEARAKSGAQRGKGKRGRQARSGDDASKEAAKLDLDAHTRSGREKKKEKEDAGTRERDMMDARTEGEGER